MSIQQIQTGRNVSRQALSPATPAATATTNSAFSALIDSAVRNRGNQKAGVDAQAATAAAELMKLDMMKSALSLTGEPAPAPFNPLSIPLNFALNVPPPPGQKIDTTEQLTAIRVEPAPSESKPQQSPKNVQEIVARASERYGVDSALIKAVIKAESNFNPSAVSRAGAQGLMQLMPSTARGLGVNDSFNPEQNVMAGTRFLKDMINRYHGNIDSALAAYNWGPGNVDRKGTSSLPQETREYLAKVKSYYNQYVG